MQKVIFRNKAGELEEFIIDKHLNKQNCFGIFHYRQFQPCRFHMQAFKSKSFQSRASASNYLLQWLNQRLDAGEITELIIT